jgi:hypothetical protein
VSEQKQKTTKTENSKKTKIPPETETLELRKNEWVCESPD